MLTRAVHLKMKYYYIKNIKSLNSMLVRGGSSVMLPLYIWVWTSLCMNYCEYDEYLVSSIKLYFTSS